MNFVSRNFFTVMFSWPFVCTVSKKMKMAISVLPKESNRGKKRVIFTYSYLVYTTYRGLRIKIRNPINIFSLILVKISVFCLIFTQNRDAFPKFSFLFLNFYFWKFRKSLMAYCLLITIVSLVNVTFFNFLFLICFLFS